MTERVKVAFEGISLSMRFVLPIIFSVFFYAYSQDQNKLHSDVTDIKNGQDRTWMAIKSVDIKIDAVRDKESSDFTYVLEHYVKPQ